MAVNRYGTREERAAAVLIYAAEHPRAGERVIAAALGIPRGTVHDDLTRARRMTIERPADDYRAVMIARNETLIAALMPKALAGSPRHAETILAADKRTAELIGLDAPRELKIAHEIKERAKMLAAEFGLDVADVLAEAEAIVTMAAADTP